MENLFIFSFLSFLKPMKITNQSKLMFKNECEIECEVL